METVLRFGGGNLGAELHFLSQQTSFHIVRKKAVTCNKREGGELWGKRVDVTNNS